MNLKPLLPLLFPLLLLSCTNYEVLTETYGGSHNDDGGTVGLRVTSFLDSENEVDAGVAADVSYLDRDNGVSQWAFSPLLAVRWRPTEYVEPYIMAGPSVVLTESEADLGSDFRLGVAYRLGSVATKPWWVFVEGRALYADPDIGGGGGFEENHKSRDFSSSYSDYYDSSPTPSPLPRDEVEPWNVGISFGVGIRW